MADWNAISAFMAAVVPWPGSLQDPGYVNLQCSVTDRNNPAGKKRIANGWPFRTVDGIINRASWVGTTTQWKDTWFCLSLQKEAKPNPNGSGKLQAVRKSANAIAAKAVWIDVDVGKPGAYPNIPAAVKAIMEFKDKVGLPLFSAIVGSGSGVHVYWISDKSLTPAEWRPYAEGLKSLLLQHGIKCDAGLTTDIARILRFPGTLNHKTEPPKPVELFPVPLVMYDFATALKILPTVAPIKAAPATATTSDFNPFAEGVDPKSFDKPDFVIQGPSLSAGIDKFSEQLLSAEPILKQCGFMSHALKTGGADYANPLWNLSVLCSTFMENGNAIAHALSQGHATYTPDATQALYDRKLAERHDRGLGYPSCATIQGNGCKSCATCPHLSKGKSPLNLGLASAGATAQGSGNGPWPKWPDALDFDKVPEAEAIARVNAAGFFVLTVNGDIYKVEPGGGVTVQKREGFNNLFACRKALVGNSQSYSAGAAWKSSTDRREYDKIGYWPGGSGGPKSYNLWQGWGVEPNKGNWTIIHSHVLEVLACGDERKANYILDWCAHMVQRPQEKPGVALVFRGRKGTGKTLLTLLVAAAIGRRNALITASGKKLFSNFNWHLADKLLIGAEEAFFAGNRELNDQLKHLLTGDDIEVEQKFGQRIIMKSMHRMIMNSNHDQVISASDDERRFFVCDVSEARRGDDGYFGPLVSIIKGADNATLAAFLYELQTRDITNWKPERAAREASSTSSDLARQKLLSLDPPLQWLLEVDLDIHPSRNTTEDTGPPTQADLDLDERIKAKLSSIPTESLDAQDTTRRRLRSDMLSQYRDWVKSAQVRGAGEFTGSEIFWSTLKRLLNNDIFPGRKLFRTSGGTRMVILPPRHELLEGFNRLLGGHVVETDADQLQDK